MSAEVTGDVRAIEAVLVRYANGIDRKDMEMVRSCFAPDVRAEYSGTVLTQGVEAVLDLVAVVHQYRSTLHLMGNFDVAVTGDTARSVCRCVAYLVRDDEGRESLAMRALAYEDELERSGGEWRITARRHVPVWSVELPATSLQAWPSPS